MEAAAVEGREGTGQGIDQCADGGADDVLSAVIVAGVTGDMQGAAVIPPARENHNHGVSPSPARLADVPVFGMSCWATVSGAPCLVFDAVPCGLTVDCWTPACAAMRFLTVSMPSKSIISSAMSA